MKQSTKKHCKSFLALFLTVAILVGGAFAFLAATDSRNNVFTIGSVAIELNEEGWVETENGKWTKNDGSSSNIVPGAEIEKAPTVKNTGMADAWVYLTVGVPTAQGTDGKVSSVDTSELQMPVNAYAIQDGYEENFTSEAVWSAYFDAEEIFGAPLADASDRVELFDIYTGVNLNELGLGWELLSATPYSVDGYNYYTYVYQSKLTPNSETSALFETVVYGADVEDVNIPDTHKFYGTMQPIPEGYVPEDGDKIVLADTGNTATFNSPSWKIDGNIMFETPVCDIPDELFDCEVEDMDPFFRARVDENGEDKCIIGKGVKLKASPNVNVIYGLSEKLTKAQLVSEGDKNPESYITYYGVEVVVTDNNPDTPYLGTGSTVTVTYPDGTVDTYDIIIFGDVDGNSVIDTEDVRRIRGSIAGTGDALANGPAKYAANIEGTRNQINSMDAQNLQRAVLYKSNSEKYASYAEYSINQRTGLCLYSGEN